MEVLSFVLSLKNTFTPVNRIPSDVLSLIPDYWSWKDGDKDRGLIKLTHVCRGWRGIFTSRPSLWTRLDCTNIDKTRTYVGRSGSSPLGVYLGGFGVTSYQEEALLLVAPHINRLKTLVVSEDSTLPLLLEYFSFPAPCLESLKINLTSEEVLLPPDDAPVLPDELFGGDLSSLRELDLAGVITSLPWRSMSNLITFDLSHVPENRILLTQLLDFFESAPRLSRVHLCGSIPDSSNAPTERVLSIPLLKKLTIIAQPAHSILLNHLSIPVGAALQLEFTYSGRQFPIQSYLPSSNNLRNLSHFTTVNLRSGSKQKSVRLSGPSGELYVHGNWEDDEIPVDPRSGQFFQSLGLFDFSRCQRLGIALVCCQPSSSTQIATWPHYELLRSMESLRTLMLSRCKNLPFISTLNPDKNPDRTVLCPELEEIILYITDSKEVLVSELLKMAKGRASRGAKLSAITIAVVDATPSVRAKNVLKLREHVSRVEYKLEDKLPQWDAVPG